MIQFSLPLLQKITSFGDTLEAQSKQSVGHFAYVFMEGTVPMSAWFDQFTELSRVSEIVNTYVTDFTGKAIATLNFSCGIGRSDILKGKVALTSSSNTNFNYRFKEEGTPNWFLLCRFSSAVDPSTTNNVAIFIAAGKVGTDINLTKSPLTEYSELSISDILISNT